MRRQSWDIHPTAIRWSNTKLKSCIEKYEDYHFEAKTKVHTISSEILKAFLSIIHEKLLITNAPTWIHSSNGNSQR
jgi:hypothetical protein